MITYNTPITTDTIYNHVQIPLFKVVTSNKQKFMIFRQ